MECPYCDQNIFLNTVGLKISCKTDINLSEAVNLRIYYKKPNGVRGWWSGLLDETDTRIEYITRAGDLDVSGDWTISAHFTLNGWTGYTESDTFKVKNIFSS